MQKKKNSQGMYFLVDRPETGQKSSPNLPGKVTQNGVGGKGKKVTFALKNTPDPEPLPHSKSLHPIPLVKINTRGHLESAPATQAPRARAAAPPLTLPSPVEPASRDGPPGVPQQRQAGTGGPKGQSLHPPAACSGEGDLALASKAEKKRPKVCILCRIDSHAHCSHARVEKEISFCDDEAHDECDDEVTCASLMQKIALGPTPLQVLFPKREGVRKCAK